VNLRGLALVPLIRQRQALFGILGGASFLGGFADRFGRKPTRKRVFMD
jgi:hypothetical protein